MVVCSRIRACSAVALAAMLMACAPKTDADLRDDCRRFLFAPQEPYKTVGEFREYELATQYRLVLCVYSLLAIVEGRDYLTEFASNGQSAVPLLTDELRKAQPDTATLILVAVLARMAALGSYAVGSDAQLLQLAHVRVEAMQDASLRATARTILQQIVSAPQPAP